MNPQDANHTLLCLPTSLLKTVLFFAYSLHHILRRPPSPTQVCVTVVPLFSGEICLHQVPHPPQRQFWTRWSYIRILWWIQGTEGQGNSDGPRSSVFTLKCQGQNNSSNGEPFDGGLPSSQHHAQKATDQNSIPSGSVTFLMTFTACCPPFVHFRRGRGEAT